MIELLGAKTEAKQRSQQEYDDAFLDIARLIGINSQLATLIEEHEGRESAPDIFTPDLQAEEIARLTEERDAMLSEILRNPEAAFSHEFELLGRLYEGRTVQSVDTLGSSYGEFVTRDPSRQRADLHFRQIAYDGGSLEQIVEVPGVDGAASYYISLKEGTLRLATTVYQRGATHRIEVDAESEQGKHMLMNFFSHSITASDLMFNRLPEEIAQADAQALRFLREKKQRQNAY